MTDEHYNGPTWAPLPPKPSDRRRAILGALQGLGRVAVALLWAELLTLARKGFRP
jgi:hypothetical protein